MIAKVLVVMVFLGMACAQMRPVDGTFPGKGLVKKPGMGMGTDGKPNVGAGPTGRTTLLYAPTPVVEYDGRHVYNVGGVGYPHYYPHYNQHYYNPYYGYDSRYYNPYYSTDGRYIVY